MMLNPGHPGFVDVERSTVTFWGEGTEPFDMTTVEDTARITARLALDTTATTPPFGNPQSPRYRDIELTTLSDHIEVPPGP